VPLTPRTIALSARGGLALCAAGIVSLEATEPAALPLVLAGGGWCVSMLALLSFPRIRKNDLLLAIGGSSSLAGFLTASPDLTAASLNAAAGATGPGLIALTLAAMRIRQLAGENWHMPFVEWRQIDRRRRARRQSPVVPIGTIQIDA
jgi:hypothetical protein